MDSQFLNKIQLTNYLYIYDEVKYSLLVSLILKDNFDEVLFWLTEIYESGFYEELWQFTYCIYYDFYAIQNPYMCNYIKKLNSKWLNDNSIVYFIKCYKNLYFKNISSEIFYIRIFSNNYSKLHKSERKFKLFIGRKPTICNSFERKYSLFVWSLQKKHFENIAYFMNEYDEKVFEELIKKYIILNDCFNNSNDINNVYYKNKKHIALFEYFSLFYEKNLNTKNVYLSISKKELMLYSEYKSSISPVYKTLSNKMHYPINYRVSKFNLNRDNIEYNELKNLFWYHWQVLCYNTPCWKKRFEEHNIKLIQKSNKVYLQYPNDNVFEEFWEKYDYEFDEQSKETQNKALRQLEFIKSEDKMINGKIFY
jgi:hypothetical protein